MATLKEHQAAMVDLLANGSGIPASASRLAHAMHDVLQELLGEVPVERLLLAKLREDATTPGLNDKALSKPQKPLKTDSPAKWPTPAEQRVKELENTIRQLKANNAKLRAEKEFLVADCAKVRADYQMLQDKYLRRSEAEQAGCRREDMQVWEPDCDHAYAHINMENKTLECGRCGHNVPWPDNFNPEPPKAPV